MVNWYGIEGITYHPNAKTGTFEVTYSGIRDDYATYLDDASLDLMPDETCTFEEYMQTNSHAVMRYINLVREDRRA